MEINEKQRAALNQHCPELTHEIEEASHGFAPSVSDKIQTRIKMSMKNLLDDVTEKNRDFSKQEQIEFDSLKMVIDGVHLRTMTKEPVWAMPDGQIPRADKGWRCEKTGAIIPVYGKADKIPVSNHAGPGLGSIVQAMFLGSRGNTEVHNALSVGTDGSGGYHVPEHLVQSVIEKMRAKSRVSQAGAQTVLLPQGTVNMTRVATEPTPTWRAENAAVTESNPTFERVTFTAQSLDVLVKSSIELLEDSPNMDAVITELLATCMADEIDRVSLLGSGSGEPTGLDVQANVLSQSMGTNGAALTRYTDLMTALQTLAEANAPEPTGAIMAPRTYFDLEGMADTTNQPLQKPAPVGNVPFLQTSKVPIDDTQGTATDASKIYLGDYSQMMLGVRVALDLMVARELYAANRQVGFFARMRFDVQLAQPTAFLKVVGIVP